MDCSLTAIAARLAMETLLDPGLEGRSRFGVAGLLPVICWEGLFFHFDAFCDL